MSFKDSIPPPLRKWLAQRKAGATAVSRKVGHKLGLGKKIWEKALPEEISFWDDFIGSRGASYDAEEEFAFRIDPNSQLQPWLADYLSAPTGSTVRILDVGAGPLTWVGKKHDGWNVEIEAIDPLAESYDKALDGNGVVPPVRTKKGNGEDIVEIFGPESFDITFARNCLDHAFDAVKAVRDMVEATKPGGIMCLWHQQDEAERMQYHGLHQWNFHAENGELTLSSPNVKVNVNKEFAGKIQCLRCDIANDWSVFSSAREMDEGMIEAVYRKL